MKFVFIPLMLSVALSLPITMPRTTGMIPRPLYAKPAKISKASYLETIDSNSNYHALFEITSDIPVFHLMNFPGIQNVFCNGQTVSVKTDQPELMQDWLDLKQIMLVMDFYECPVQDEPFHISKSWNVNGNTINFDIEPASKSDIDASINVLIQPVLNGKHVFDTIHDQGIDTYFSKIRESPDDKTFTYPYHFNFHSEKTWNLRGTKGFLKCETCNITGDINLVLNIKGTLRSNYSMEAYISGNIVGSLDLAAGFKKQIVDDKTILYEIDFPGFELPGILEARPSFSVYSLSSLSGNEQVSFNSKVLSRAKDFRLSLFSVSGGHGKFKFEGADKFEISSFKQTQQIQTPQNRFSFNGLDQVGAFMKRSQSGNHFVDSDLSIVADFKLGYKMIGSPKAELNAGVRNTMKGLYGVLDPKDECPRHLSGNINAYSSLFTDVGGNNRILKETPPVTVWEGCFGKRKF